MPFQCSMSVVAAVPLPVRPTAHTSFADTPASESISVNAGDAAGTTLHRLPSQCSRKDSPLALREDPAAHTSVGEMATTAVSALLSGSSEAAGDITVHCPPVH